MPKLSLSALLALSLALLACGTAGPTIDPLERQIVAVGTELVLEVKASNSNGSDISIDFSTNANIDEDRGGITQRPGGSALFTWTPSAQDIGTWSFDFTAKDKTGKATETITIEVRSAIGQDSVPVFRRPLGAGTALDAAGDGCVELDVLVEDQDSLKVELSVVEPHIEGGELIQDGDLEGTWKWCPSKAQRNAQDRYMLTIAADDGENPKALKHYQIILREPANSSCNGEPPVIRHTPADVEGIDELTIEAAVTDDRGIKGAVNLYYSNEAPANPPNLSAMIMAPMELAGGSPQNGAWSVTLPNPVADAAAGTTADLFYVIVADDNDDKAGKCDNSTTASFQMAVTAVDPIAGLGLCESCTHDRQCGGTDDLCLTVGVEDEKFCFTSCTTDTECPLGYNCSVEPLSSQDGGEGRVCIPADESCASLPCDDDAYEQNDGITQLQPLPEGGLEDLRMCPFKEYAADEDWFEFTLDRDAEVVLEVVGKYDDPNIDMRLLDDAGNLLAVSEDFGSEDSITRCLTAGTYRVRTYSYLFYKIYVGEELQDMGNDYDLILTTKDAECSTGGTCEDDPFEEDDNISQAQIPDFGGLGGEWSTTGLQICSGDQDWYMVEAYNNQNFFSIRLNFEQLSSDEDLDILIYDAVGDLVTHCLPGDTSGCTNNGQSGDSDEFMIFFPPEECSLPIDCESCAPCTYYVVVNGFAGAENSYDLCIGYDSENTCAE